MHRTNTAHRCTTATFARYYSHRKPTRTIDATKRAASFLPQQRDRVVLTLALCIGINASGVTTPAFSFSTRCADELRDMLGSTSSPTSPLRAAIKHALSIVSSFSRQLRFSLKKIIILYH